MFPPEYYNFGLLKIENAMRNRVDVYSGLYSYRSIQCCSPISRVSWVGRSILVEFEGCNYGFLYHDFNTYDRVAL